MKFYLLGNGMIANDHHEMKLSFRKAYALIFYLLIEKTVPRNSMVHLLWGDLSEDSAKRNLRNAVYVIRKNIHNDLITSPKRDLLKINMDIIDYVDIFSIEDMTSEMLLEIHDLVFLNGFHLGEAPYFDEWLNEQRYHYAEMLIKRMSFLAVEALQNDQAVTAEKLCRKMIWFDEYDENAYRLLFRALEMQKKHNAIASSYNQLCESLNKDLMLRPDDATKLAFENAMMNKVRHDVKAPVIYGRREELNVLKSALYRHEHYKEHETVLVHGTYGIGKSTLMNAFYECVEKDYLVLEGRCYKAEMDFPLSPWIVLLEELRDHLMLLPDHDQPQNMQYVEQLINGEQHVHHFDDTSVINSYFIEKVIIEWFGILNKYKTMILLFDDIQWMDKISFKILLKLMSINMFIAVSLNTDYVSLEEYKDMFLIDSKLTKLALKPFDKIESFEFIKGLLSEMNLELDYLEQVYSKSGGNPLFISEIVSLYDTTDENTPQKLLDAMESKWHLLSSVEQKLLSVASNFYNTFQYEDIASISGMEEWTMLETLTLLVKKGILLEVKRYNEQHFAFSHQLFRECVYHQLPPSIRRIYHLKIGDQLEKKHRQPSLHVLYRLMHNYSLANELVKELKYRIRFVTDYFNVVHEMFPVVGNHMSYYTDYSEIIDLDELHIALETIEVLFQKVHKQLLYDQHFDLLFSYYKLIGRYYNIRGYYKEAKVCIDEMYKLACQRGQDNELLSAYLQMIYYDINIRDIDALDKHLKGARKYASGIGMNGVLLRLEGYGLILKGAFDEGILIMKQVIEYFQAMEDHSSYILNIIGAYYYMGEAYHFKGVLQESMIHYEKAMSLCIKHGYHEKLAFLYGAKGQLYYEMGEYDFAEKNLEKAKDIYGKIDAAWGKAINLGYYGLCSLRKQKFKETLYIFKNIEERFSLMNYSYQKALILRIKAEACYYLKNNHIQHELTDYITCGEEKYCLIAIDQLKNINSTYEVDLLKKMNALCGLCKTQHIS